MLSHNQVKLSRVAKGQEYAAILSSLRAQLHGWRLEESFSTTLSIVLAGKPVEAHQYYLFAYSEFYYDEKRETVWPRM